MAGRAKADRNGTGVATPALPPDVIGDSGRARIIAEMLDSLQSQKFRIVTAMVGNGEGEDDICRGVFGPNGKVMTYGERIAQLEQSETRLMEQFGEYLPQVEKLLVAIRQERGE